MQINMWFCTSFYVDLVLKGRYNTSNQTKNTICPSHYNNTLPIDYRCLRISWQTGSKMVFWSKSRMTKIFLALLSPNRIVFLTCEHFCIQHRSHKRRRKVSSCIYKKNIACGTIGLSRSQDYYHGAISSLLWWWSVCLSLCMRCHLFWLTSRFSVCYLQIVCYCSYQGIWKTWDWYAKQYWKCWVIKQVTTLYADVSTKVICLGFFVDWKISPDCYTRRSWNHKRFT